MITPEQQRRFIAVGVADKHFKQVQKSSVGKNHESSSSKTSCDYVTLFSQATTMAFVDWYVPQVPKKTLKDKKVLQYLSQDDDVALRRLLESGLDPNTKIRYWSMNRSLVHIALVANHAYKCVKILCDFGCDFQVDFEENPAIFHALHEPKLLEILLIHEKHDPNQLSQNGSTPLIEAVKINNFQVVQMLIQNGAEVDKMDANGQNPLIHACSNVFLHLGILKLLCQRTTDPLILDPKSKKTVLELMLEKFVLAPKKASQKYLKKSLTKVGILLQNLDEFSRLELLDFHGSGPSILHLVLKHWNENRVQYFTLLLEMILDLGANDFLPLHSKDSSILSVVPENPMDLDLGNKSLNFTFYFSHFAPLFQTKMP